MSRVNIQGTIDNITSQTNVYTPIRYDIIYLDSEGNMLADKQ
jgi:hypothetical protein